MENARDKKLATRVGQTRKLMDAGYTVSEIAEKLKLPESTIRSYKHIIDTAIENQK